MEIDEPSPRYNIKLNQDSLEQQWKYRIAQCDADQIQRAWHAVQHLASLDHDHAQQANGVGFSKSDTRLGHNLSLWPLERVIRREILMIQFLKLARKYRRQLPPEYIVDQPRQ